MRYQGSTLSLLSSCTTVRSAGSLPVRGIWAGGLGRIRLFCEGARAGQLFPHRAGPRRTLAAATHDLEIKEVRTHHLTEDQFFDSMYDVSPQEVARRVNEGSVHLTFLEEYYACRSAFFVLYVQDEDESRYCLQVKVSYRTIRYEWNGVDLTSPF